MDGGGGAAAGASSAARAGDAGSATRTDGRERTRRVLANATRGATNSGSGRGRGRAVGVGYGPLDGGYEGRTPRIPFAMLEDLLAFIERQEHEVDDSFVRLDSIEFSEVNAILRLSVLDADTEERWAVWSVTARQVKESRVEGPFGALSVTESGHVLSRQHTDPHRGLSFRGSPRSAHEVVGRLYSAHREVAGRWIPFERYLNTLLPLDDLLSGGFGQLGNGPAFLMAVYAEVLRSAGISATLLEPRPAKHWNGTRWEENPKSLATLALGDAYVVCEHLESTRVTGS